MKRHTAAGSFLLLAAALAACSDGTGTSADSGAPDAGDTDADTETVDDSDSSDEIVGEFDIPYDPPEDGDPEMSLLDVYYLPDGEPKHLMVFVHGGSWVGGDKSNLELAPDLVPWFVERGFVVAAPNFRLSSPLGAPLEVSYADQATDVAYALDWLDEHGGDYGVTEPGVVLMGYSSGAHLVALLASDEHYLQLVDLTHAHLAAAMSFDVHAYHVPYALSLMQGSELEMNIPLIEHLFGDTEEQQLVGSPAVYVADAEVPATLLISADPSAEEGTKGYISKMATEQHHQLLSDLGHASTWSHYDDETHSSLVLDFGTEGDGPTDETAAFLDGLSL